MPKHPTVVVLTPGLGGDYFGDVLAGLSREIVAADGRLIVVETLQEHVRRTEVSMDVPFTLPLALDLANGFISLTNAVDAEYLKGLDATGFPVVVLSGSQETPDSATTVRPDNEAGTVAAVEHLIGHGHSRIGFLGNLAQRDILDRLDAYRDTLRAHGLTPDPDLVFDAPENGEPGGVVAAHRVLAGDERPTALMVATDRNAIGLVRTLADNGLSVPRDVAVAAFDNIAAGALGSPALTSVEASADEVGALAGRRVLERMRGAAVPLATPHESRLVVRESCGCRVGAEYEQGEVPASDPEVSRQRLLDMLEALLLRDLRTGDEAADRASRDTVVAIVARVASMLARGESVTPVQIQELVESLRSLSCRPGALSGFADALTSHWSAAGSADAAVASATAARIAAAVWKVQAGASLHRAEATDRAIAEQYTVDAGLLDTEGADPRDLTWLAGTHVNAGVLALWDGGPESGRLTVVGEHCTDGGPTLVGTTLRTEAFPPAQLVERATGINREMCVVVPVHTREREWGVLALVAPFETTSARETYRHWAALLCAALESQRREDEVRRSALFDALTGLPNRRLFVRQLDQALARRKRDGTPFAVLFMDLDGFKLINDSLGHQMGDKVLMAVGAAIDAQVRAVDTAARFGGDEFVILLADTDGTHALGAASRIQAALESVREIDGREVVTRASIGVASSAVDYVTAEDVLRDAEFAMYRAKAAEPGSVAFFDESMRERAVEWASLATDVLTRATAHELKSHR